MKITKLGLSETINSISRYLALALVMVWVFSASTAMAQKTYNVRVLPSKVPAVGKVLPTSASIVSVPQSVSLAIDDTYNNAAYSFSYWVLGSTNIVLDPGFSG